MPCSLFFYPLKIIKNVYSFNLLFFNDLSLKADTDMLYGARLTLVLCQKDQVLCASSLIKNSTSGSVCFSFNGEDGFDLKKRDNITAYVFVQSPDLSTPSGDCSSMLTINSIYSVKIAKKNQGSIALTLTVCILILLIIAVFFEIFRQIGKNAKAKKRRR